MPMDIATSSSKKKSLKYSESIGQRAKQGDNCDFGKHP
jgi:hypothetical protein